MLILNLYENVKLTAPDVHEHDFLLHLDTSARSLIARYGVGYVLIPGAVYSAPRSRDGEMPIYEEYFSALRDNILFLLTGDAAHKTDFLSEADQAYLQVWKAKMRGKKFRDRGYSDV